MIATNNYIERWKSTAKDVDQYAFSKNKEVVIHLFTNEVESAKSWATSHLKRVTLKTHKIQGWGWPEATLYRYKFISEYGNEIKEDFLMYLDSDMQIVKEFSTELFKDMSNCELAFVQHPGFFRNIGSRKYFDYLRNPRLIGPHLRKLIARSSTIGSWEVSRSSKAFTIPSSRKEYVHGAVWFGYKKAIMSMCAELNSRVDEDLKSGYIAIWHDESHLNWYASNHDCKILDSRYSGVREYKHIRILEPSIFTVKKEIGEGRAPTEPILSHEEK